MNKGRKMTTKWTKKYMRGFSVSDRGSQQEANAINEASYLNRVNLASMYVCLDKPTYWLLQLPLNKTHSTYC